MVPQDLVIHVTIFTHSLGASRGLSLSPFVSLFCLSLFVFVCLCLFLSLFLFTSLCTSLPFLSHLSFFVRVSLRACVYCVVCMCFFVCISIPPSTSLRYLYVSLSLSLPTAHTLAVHLFSSELRASIHPPLHRVCYLAHNWHSIVTPCTLTRS